MLNAPSSPLRVACFFILRRNNIDPVTLATGALTALKAAASARKTIGGLVSDIDKVFNAVSELKKPLKKPMLASKDSVEKIALQQFANQKKAEELEREMRNQVLMHYGQKGWDEVVRLMASARKLKQMEALAAQKKRRKAFEFIIATAVTVAFGIVVIIVMFIIYKVVSR
jgi:hypothetical protein